MTPEQFATHWHGSQVRKYTDHQAGRLDRHRRARSEVCRGADVARRVD